MKEPQVASKRGGPRLNPWWRVYKESSELALRWHRQLEHAEPTEIHDVIDEILGEG
jgi:hypothetical protein